MQDTQFHNHYGKLWHIFLSEYILPLFVQFRAYIFIPLRLFAKTQWDNKWTNYSSSLKLWQDFLKTLLNSCFVSEYTSSKPVPFFSLIRS